MQKKNILSKFKFFLIAIIILVLGYFFGIIILGIIAVVIALISIFFIISLFFSKGLLALTNKKVKLFFAMIFSSALTILIIYLLRNIIFKITSKSTQIILIWVIATILFSVLWTLLVIRKRKIYSNDQTKVIEYNKIKENKNIKTFDFIFILIISIIITVSFNIIYNIL